MLALYGLLGVCSGLAAVVFAELVDFGQAYLIDVAAPDRYRFAWELPSGKRWLFLVIPATGGIVSGLLCAWLAPETMGTGISQAVDAYHHHDGEIRPRVAPVKAVASAVTLGTGGSGGLEGPIAQISGAIGTLIATRFGLQGRERRVLMMAGFAAGIGAVFHAPMAAAIFAAEVLYSEMDIEHEVLVPAIIASTVSYGVFGAVRGWEPMFAMPEVTFSSGLQLLPYLALAAVLSAGAVAFIVLFRTVDRRLGHNSAIPLWARPAIGGLLVGIVGVFLPSVLGAGYGIVQLALNGHEAVVILLALAVAKALVSAFTAGSGGASGLFAPSLVIGGLLGGAVGAAAAWFAPQLEIQPAAFVVVGMGGFVAAVVNAPLSTVIMVAEVVGNYRLIVPTLWVCTLCWLMTRRWTLFREQAPTRFDAPGQLSDMMGAVLHRISVGDAIDKRKPEPISVSPQLPLRELVEHFASTKQSVFPIVSAGVLRGVVDGRQLRRTVGEKGVDTFLIANDFQVKSETVTPADTLYDAISRMTATGYDELVITAEDDLSTLVGLISRREIVNAYHRRMLQRAPGMTGEWNMPVDLELCDLCASVERGGIVRGVGGSNPSEAIGLLIAHADLPTECDRKLLLTLLLEREALGSTGVGNGIALPHPHADELAGITAPRVIIGLLAKPVDWGAYDGRSVDTVCVLLCPSGEMHLTLLGELARALSDKRVLHLLRQRAALPAVIKGVRAALDPTSK